LAAKRQTYESPRQLARRAAILEATRELLTKRGYAGTTVRDVAERARVAKGTLYNIYGGKDELIFAAVIDVRDDILGLTNDLSPSSGLDQQLKSNRAVMKVITENPNYTEAVAHAVFGAPPAKMLVPSLIGRPIEAAYKDLEASKALGQIDPDTDSMSIARQVEMQRWGLILAVFVEQMPLEDLNREVSLSLVRVLRSVALPKGHEVIDAHVAEIGLD